MKRFFLRMIIISTWTGVIFGALYLPKISFLKNEHNTIHVFAWGDILEPSVIAKFEKETGIKIRISYYASNEELIVKMKATKGQGYDLIIPSDYAVKVLINENLLQPIAKEKLSFWHEIHPGLLGHEFDPKNTYSIPLEWEIFGFGINKDYFANQPFTPSWKLIFNKDQIHYKIAMCNDPIEATLFAGYYLFKSTNPIDEAQSVLVKNLLKQQKKWVEAYANFRGDYFLATKNCPVAVASSSYIWKTMRQFPFITFVVPEEGTFLSIENLALSSAAKNQELAYQFINYLFRHESVIQQFKTFGFFPSTLQSIDNVEIDPLAKEFIGSIDHQFSNFHFTKEIMSQEKIHELWVEVKSEGE